MLMVVNLEGKSLLPQSISQYIDKNKNTLLHLSVSESYIYICVLFKACPKEWQMLAISVVCCSNCQLLDLSG